MEHKASLKIVLLTMGSTLLVALVMLAMLSPLHKSLAVEVKWQEFAAATPIPLPRKPENLSVTAYYEMEENSKKISAVYIELFSVGGEEVFYFEVPSDTKINLSEDLYKSLQTYAPELPQYLKLSNMAESFSDAYGLTGCNRILSEVLGIAVKEYVRADREAMQNWFAMQAEQLPATQYFAKYKEWIQSSVSSRTPEERWIYYESRQLVKKLSFESAPGTREKDGFLLSGKRSKERLEELKLSVAGFAE